MQHGEKVAHERSPYPVFYNNDQAKRLKADSVNSHLNLEVFTNSLQYKNANIANFV